MEIIKVQNLSFSYPGADKPVLDDVSFSIEAGEFALLIGATGSGKSTLMRLLKRELAPLGELSGHVFFSGRNQQDLNVREAACSIGYVMQRPACSFHS